MAANHVVTTRITGATTYTTTHKDQTQTRTSKTMSYTHAVWAWNTEHDVPGVMRWSQSVDAAHTYAKTLANKGYRTAIEDVRVEAKAVKATKADAATTAVVKALTPKVATKTQAKAPKAAKTVEPTAEPKVRKLAEGKVDHTGHDHAMTTWGRRQCQRAAGAGRFAEQA